MLRALLALLGLLTLDSASATVRLGDPLPPHPWAISQGAEGSQGTDGSPSADDQDGPRQLVVVYSHDCGDLGGLWQGLLHSGLPIHAVNAEDIASPAPQGIEVWHGPQATQFSRKLRVSAYPAVLLVSGERILNAWEGLEAVQQGAQLLVPGR